MLGRKELEEFPLFPPEGGLMATPATRKLPEGQPLLGLFEEAEDGGAGYEDSGLDG